MELICANCAAIINPEDVNIATDMAKCSACNSLHRASSLMEQVSVADLMTQPHNAKLQMQQGRYNSVELTLPSKGVDVSTVFAMLFAVFWLGFVSVWKVLASMGSIVFALFSIPFWFVGFMMLKNTINDIKEVHKVTFNNNEVTIEKHRPLFAQKEVIERANIKDVKMESILGIKNLSQSFKMKPRVNGIYNTPREYPAIVTTNETHFFFENLSEAEQQWAVRLLKHVLVGK
jgi:hypothetical protein